MSYFSEYPLSSTLSKYITLNAIVLMEYNAAFLYANADFHFLMMWQPICKYEPLLIRSQCRVSDTQVTVKALRSLVYIRIQTCSRRSRVLCPY